MTDPGQCTVGSSTSNPWARPDLAKRLGLQLANPSTTIKMEGNESNYDDDEEEDDDDLYSDDDDVFVSDDDFDGANTSCTRDHKMFRVFFKTLDMFNSEEEINDPAHKYQCPACQDRYRGLQSLFLHAKTKGSKRVKLHRKFANVLSEELEKRGVSLLPPAELFGQWEGPKPDVKDVTIVWPPMVIIMNTFLDKDHNDMWRGMGNEELLLSFGEYGAMKAKHSYGPQGHRGMSVLLFEKSARGYIEAQRLDDHFLKEGRGRADWDHGPVLFGPGRKRRLFGFMAAKEDLDIFNRHSHGNSRLKYEMRSYEEMVVKQIAQMSEDNELLIWYQKRAATAEKLAKINEQSLKLTSQKLRQISVDTKHVTERSKLQLQDNKEEMDYQAQFFEERFKEIREGTAPMVSDYKKFQEATNKDNIELFNSRSSCMVDFGHRVEEKIQSLELNMQDMQSLVTEKMKLVKICQDKMNEAETAFREAKMEVEKEFEAAFGTLLERYKAHSFKGSVTSHA